MSMPSKLRQRIESIGRPRPSRRQAMALERKRARRALRDSVPQKEQTAVWTRTMDRIAAIEKSALAWRREVAARAQARYDHY